MLRKVGGFFAGYICLCSILFTFAAAGDAVSSEEESTGLMLGMMVFFGATAWGSFKISRHLFSDPNERKVMSVPQKSHEQQILELAMMNDGKLTIAEIAAHTPLSVADAKAGIEALTREGVASVEFDEQKDIYYHFPGLS